MHISSTAHNCGVRQDALARPLRVQNFRRKESRSCGKLAVLAASDKQREAEVCFSSLQLFREVCVLRCKTGRGLIDCNISWLSHRFNAHASIYSTKVIIKVAVATGPAWTYQDLGKEASGWRSERSGGCSYCCCRPGTSRDFTIPVLNRHGFSDNCQSSGHFQTRTEYRNRV